MSTFLLWYLLVTGALAALALLAPGLVVIGFFLIVPGFVLALAPTAFLWGAIFAAAWWPAQALVGAAPATLVATATTVWLLRRIPAQYNRALDARVAALRCGDVLPAEPVPLRGVTVLERTEYSLEDPTDHTDVRRWRRIGRGRVFADVHEVEPGPYPLACDALCAATLFTPGVDAVVLRPVAAPGAAAPDGAPAPAPGLPEPALFRIDRSGACRSSVQPAPPRGDGWRKDAAALLDEWRVRISRGECITRTATDGADARADLTLSLLRWTDPPGRKPRSNSWSLAAPVLSVRRVELRDHDGSVLLRQTAVESDRGRLARVLEVVTWGGLENFRFTWSRERGEGMRGPSAARTFADFETVELLARWTSLRLASDPGRALADGLTQLRALLADPTRDASDPGFALSARVLQEMAERGPTADDLALAAALVADRRVREFRGLDEVIEKLGADALRLRPVLATRIRNAAVNDYGDPGPDRNFPDWARFPRDDPGVGALAQAFRHMPTGAFVRLHPEEAALLDDPARRAWVPALVTRMLDAGPRMVPWFVHVIRDGYREQHRSRRLFLHVSPDVDAARDALARLGPEAAGALAPLERMFADGLIPAAQLHDAKWQTTLLRLGKPVESFAPRDGSRSKHEQTPEQFHQHLRELLARYELSLAKGASGRG